MEALFLETYSCVFNTVSSSPDNNSTEGSSLTEDMEGEENVRMDDEEETDNEGEEGYLGFAKDTELNFGNCLTKYQR